MSPAFDFLLRLNWIRTDKLMEVKKNIWFNGQFFSLKKISPLKCDFNFFPKLLMLYFFLSKLFFFERSRPVPNSITYFNPGNLGLILAGMSFFFACFFLSNQKNTYFLFFWKISSILMFVRQRNVM